MTRIAINLTAASEATNPSLFYYKVLNLKNAFKSPPLKFYSIPLKFLNTYSRLLNLPLTERTYCIDNIFLFSHLFCII